MTGELAVEFAALIFALVSAVIGLAFNAGRVSARVNSLEKSKDNIHSKLEKIDKEVGDLSREMGNIAGQIKRMNGGH